MKPDGGDSTFYVLIYDAGRDEYISSVFAIFFDDCGNLHIRVHIIVNPINLHYDSLRSHSRHHNRHNRQS